MLSLKAQYGLKAMVSLAGNYGKGPLQAREVAVTQNVPVRYLELLLSQLRRARLVEATRGKNGGYILSRDPNLITVWDVVTAFEGKTLFPELRVKENPGGRLDPFTFIWKNAEKRLIEHLNSLKIAEVLEEVQLNKEMYFI